MTNDLGQGQWPPFSIPAKGIPRRIFGTNLVIFKSIIRYCVDKPSFLEFSVEKAKITLKVEVNDLHFQYQTRVSQGRHSFQIWKFQPKSVTIYRANRANWLAFCVKTALEGPWRSRSMTSVFNASPEYTMMHVWCMISISWCRKESSVLEKGFTCFLH